MLLHFSSVLLYFDFRLKTWSKFKTGIWLMWRIWLIVYFKIFNRYFAFHYFCFTRSWSQFALKFNHKFFCRQFKIKETHFPVFRVLFVLTSHCINPLQSIWLIYFYVFTQRPFTFVYKLQFQIWFICRWIINHAFFAIQFKLFLL